MSGGRLSAWTVAALVLLPSAASSQSQVLEIDFYRAMSASAVGAYDIQNFNLASIAGAAKYIHTEVLAEHVIADPERKTRKNGIDTIARMRFKVRNSEHVVAPSSQLATHVDFGPFVTFDNGVATNPQSLLWMQQYGSYVGVQQQTDVRWPYTEPYFWFSVTGWCPNVRYDEIPMSRQEATTLWNDRSRLCDGLANRVACDAHASECVFEGSACVARDSVPKCLNYTAMSGSSGHALGGLCPGGADNLDIEPTGELGCTYSYGHASHLSLDRVAGILDEDCGGHLCTDWLDFRFHCSNPAYRRKFVAFSGAVVPFVYCVEYDVHPKCEADCRADACQRLPEEDRELGLPFWRGKCSAQANEFRTEKFGKALGEEFATTMHDLVGGAVGLKKTCVQESPGMCTPLPEQGGNYCTRQWGGVCYNCFIPETSAKWPALHMPYCPYDVLQLSDYKDRFPLPKCKSALPRDLCCLYTGGCSVHATDALSVPLDEDGFALVASWRNSTAMSSFVQRVAATKLINITSDSFEEFAYGCWSRNPRKGASLDRVLEELLSKHLGMYVSTSTSTATTATLTSTSTTVTTTIHLIPAVVAGEEDGSSVSVLVVCGVLAAVLLAAVGLCAFGWTRGWWQRSAKGCEGDSSKDADKDCKDLASEQPFTLRPAADSESLPRLLGRSSGPASGGVHRFDVEKGLPPNKLGAFGDRAPSAFGLELQHSNIVVPNRTEFMDEAAVAKGKEFDIDGVPWTSVDTHVGSASSDSGSHEAAESASTSSNSGAPLPSDGDSATNPGIPRSATQ